MNNLQVKRESSISAMSAVDSNIDTMRSESFTLDSVSVASPGSVQLRVSTSDEDDALTFGDFTLPSMHKFDKLVDMYLRKNSILSPIIGTDLSYSTDEEDGTNLDRFKSRKVSSRLANNRDGGSGINSDGPSLAATNLHHSETMKQKQMTKEDNPVDKLPLPYHVTKAPKAAVASCDKSPPVGKSLTLSKCRVRSIESTDGSLELQAYSVDSDEEEEEIVFGHSKECEETPRGPRYSLWDNIFLWDRSPLSPGSVAAATPVTMEAKTPIYTANIRRESRDDVEATGDETQSTLIANQADEREVAETVLAAPLDPLGSPKVRRKDIIPPQALMSDDRPPRFPKSDPTSKVCSSLRGQKSKNCQLPPGVRMVKIQPTKSCNGKGLQSIPSPNKAVLSLHKRMKPKKTRITVQSVDDGISPMSDEYIMTPHSSGQGAVCHILTSVPVDPTANTPILLPTTNEPERESPFVALTSAADERGGEYYPSIEIEAVSPSTIGSRQLKNVKKFFNDKIRHMHVSGENIDDGSEIEVIRETGETMVCYTPQSERSHPCLRFHLPKRSNVEDVATVKISNIADKQERVNVTGGYPAEESVMEGTERSPNLIEHVFSLYDSEGNKMLPRQPQNVSRVPSEPSGQVKQFTPLKISGNFDTDCVEIEAGQNGVRNTMPPERMRSLSSGSMPPAMVGADSNEDRALPLTPVSVSQGEATPVKESVAEENFPRRSTDCESRNVDPDFSSNVKSPRRFKGLPSPMQIMTHSANLARGRAKIKSNNDVPELDDLTGVRSLEQPVQQVEKSFETNSVVEEDPSTSVNNAMIKSRKCCTTDHLLRKVVIETAFPQASPSNGLRPVVLYPILDFNPCFDEFVIPGDLDEITFETFAKADVSSPATPLPLSAAESEKEAEKVNDLSKSSELEGDNRSPKSGSKSKSLPKEKISCLESTGVEVFLVSRRRNPFASAGIVGKKLIDNSAKLMHPLSQIRLPHGKRISIKAEDDINSKAQAEGSSTIDRAKRITFAENTRQIIELPIELSPEETHIDKLRNMGCFADDVTASSWDSSVQHHICGKLAPLVIAGICPSSQIPQLPSSHDLKPSIKASTSEENDECKDIVPSEESQTKPEEVDDQGTKAMKMKEIHKDLHRKWKVWKDRVGKKEKCDMDTAKEIYSDASRHLTEPTRPSSDVTVAAVKLDEQNKGKSDKGKSLRKRFNLGKPGTENETVETTKSSNDLNGEDKNKSATKAKLTTVMANLRIPRALPRTTQPKEAGMTCATVGTTKTKSSKKSGGSAAITLTSSKLNKINQKAISIAEEREKKMSDRTSSSLNVLDHPRDRSTSRSKRRCASGKRGSSKMNKEQTLQTFEAKLAKRLEFDKQLLKAVKRKKRKLQQEEREKRLWSLLDAWEDRVFCSAEKSAHEDQTASTSLFTCGAAHQHY